MKLKRAEFMHLITWMWPPMVETTKRPYKLNFQLGSKVQALGPNKQSNISPFKFVHIVEIISGSYVVDYLVGKLSFNPFLIYIYCLVFAFSIVLKSSNVKFKMVWC
jgi:hypothetical protein